MIIYSVSKNAEQSAGYQKQLEQLLEGKDEDFKKNMMDSLQKQLKDLH